MEPVEVETVRFEVDAGVTLEGDRFTPPTPWAEPLSVTPTRSTAALDEIWSSTRPPERSSTPAGTCSASTSAARRFDWQPRWRDTRAAGCAGGDRRCRRRSTCDRRRVQLRSRCRALGDRSTNQPLDHGRPGAVDLHRVRRRSRRPPQDTDRCCPRPVPAGGRAQLGGGRLEEHRRRRGGGSRSLLPRCPAGDRRRDRRRPP